VNTTEMAVNPELQVVRVRVAYDGEAVGTGPMGVGTDEMKAEAAGGDSNSRTS